MQKRVLEIVGDGEKTEFRYTHDLKTRDLIWCLYNPAGWGCTVDVRPVDDDTIVVRFYNPPTRGETFRLVIAG